MATARSQALLASLLRVAPQPEPGAGLDRLSRAVAAKAVRWSLRMVELYARSNEMVCYHDNALRGILLDAARTLENR
jgi:hypothetical protein